MFNCEPLKIDRKAGSRFIKNTGLAIMGGIQPKILPTTFGEDAFDDGLICRFVLYMGENRVIKFNREGIDEDTYKEWVNLVGRCYDIPCDYDEDGFIRPRRLTLNADALDAWIVFHDEFQEIKPFVSDKLRGFISKLVAYYSLKFTGILHVLKNIYRNSAISSVIDKETVEDGIALTRFFIWHATKVLKLYASGQKRFTEYQERLVRVMYDLRGEVKNGKLVLHRIGELLNEDLPDKLRLTPEKVANILNKELGLRTGKSTGNLSVLIWEEEKIKKLFSQTVTSVTTVTDPDATGTTHDNGSPEYDVDDKMEEQASDNSGENGADTPYEERLYSADELEENLLRQAMIADLNACPRLQALRARRQV
jgi:hypothetical protein